MSDANNADQRTQSGGVNAKVEGDLSSGRDIVGRDVITNTTTTNVFNADNRITRGLLILLGLVIVGVLGIIFVVVTQSNAPISASQDQYVLTAQIWDIEKDHKNAVVASKQFNGYLSSNRLATDTVKQVGDWVIEQIGQKYNLNDSDIQLHVHVPADLSKENIDIQVTPPGPIQKYMYIVEQGDKLRIPIDSDALAQFGKDFMLEISRPGYNVKTVSVKWGEARDEDFTLQPTKIRIGVEEFTGDMNSVALGLMNYLATNSRLSIQDPSSLKAVEDEIAQAKEALAKNPAMQVPIRSLEVDFIISGSLELH